MQNLSVLLVTDLLFTALIYSHPMYNYSLLFALYFNIPFLFLYALHILRESYYIFVQALLCKTSAPIAI